MYHRQNSPSQSLPGDHHRKDGAMNRMTPPGERLCEVWNTYTHPKKGRTKDGKWRFIYQRKQAQLEAAVYIEECIQVVSLNAFFEE